MPREIITCWSCLAVCLSLTAAKPAQAQEDRAPLRWGADAEGGLPYIFADPERPGEYIGFEVDLVRALEKKLGQPIEFVQYDFTKLVEGLDRGDFDFAMNGLEVTDDRKRRVLFTRPYYHFQLQLAARSDEQRFDSLSELRAIGGTVGTLDNTAAWRYLKQVGLDIRAYDDQQGPYWDLEQGRIDAVLMDLPIALYVAKPNRYNARPPDVKFVGHVFGHGAYAIAVKKNNSRLRDRLDTALLALENDGTLRTIFEKWRIWPTGSLPLNRFTEFETAESEAAPAGASFGEMIVLLLRGAWMTVQLTIVGFILAVVLGLIVALVRMYAPPPFSWLAVAYIEFFRGIPVLLLLAFLYFGLPQIARTHGWGALANMTAFTAAVVGFGLNYAAYEAEIYRAGIAAVPLGQWEAAQALGMGPVLTFRRIILPQAIRVILPPMTNDLVALFKDTSIVSVIAVVELSKQYLILTRSGSGYLLEIALATAGLYLVMSVPLGLLSRFWEGRWQHSAGNR